MSLTGKKILINDIQYHVYDEGDSDRVVLLLHGMPDTSSMWAHQANALVGLQGCRAGYAGLRGD